MPFCTKCGYRMGDNDRFCMGCGTPAQPATQNYAPVAPVMQSAPTIKAYTGTEQRFTILGKELVVSSGMDAFNHYRKAFRALAQQQAWALEAEYRARVTDLDSFLIYFPEMYAKYRKPLLEQAMGIILETGVYDLSAQQFEEQHTADFCLCAEDVDTTWESFNLTIEANQERKIRMYNMLPGVVFSGITGFAAALAVNMAVSSIAEADIRNAKVSKKQRAEIFGRIDTGILMERAFTDYWRVFLSMTWQLNRKGVDVWYPNEADNASATGIYQNLISGMLPATHIPDLVVKLLQLNPYSDDPLAYIRNRIGITAETSPILDYFGLEG